MACSLRLVGRGGRVWGHRPALSDDGALLCVEAPGAADVLSLSRPAAAAAAARAAALTAVAVSATGDDVALGDARGRVYALRMRHNRWCAAVARGAGAAASALAFSTRRGRRTELVCAFSDGRVRAVDAAKGGQAVATLSAVHTSPVVALKAHARGGSMLSVSADAVVLWSLSDYTRLSALTVGPYACTGAAFAAAPHADEVLVTFTGHTTPLVWRTATGAVERHVEDNALVDDDTTLAACDVSADGTLLVAVGDTPFVLVWDAHSGAFSHAVQLPDAATGATAISFVRGSNVVAVLCSDAVARYINLSTATQVAQLAGTTAATDACGRYTAVLSAGGARVTLYADAHLPRRRAGGGEAQATAPTLPAPSRASRAALTAALPTPKALANAQAQAMDAGEVPGAPLGGAWAGAPAPAAPAAHAPPDDVPWRQLDDAELEAELEAEIAAEMDTETPTRAAAKATPRAFAATTPASPPPLPLSPPFSPSEVPPVRYAVPAMDESVVRARSLRKPLTKAAIVGPPHEAHYPFVVGVAGAIARDGYEGSRARLRGLLSSYGRFPERHRRLVWSHLLRLPMLAEAYAASMRAAGARGLVQAFRGVATVRDGRVAGRAERALGCLVVWCADLSAAEWLPGFAYPFVCLFGAEEHACTEALATLLLNHFGGLLGEGFPGPARTALRAVDDLLASQDTPLWTALAGAGAVPAVYAWPLLSTAFSEVLARDAWLVCMDHVVANDPSFLTFLVLAWLTSTARTELMDCRYAEEVAAVVRRVSRARGNDLCRRAYAMRREAFDRVQAEAGPAFRPLHVVGIDVAGREIEHPHGTHVYAPCVGVGQG